MGSAGYLAVWLEQFIEQREIPTLEHTGASYPVAGPGTS